MDVRTLIAQGRFAELAASFDEAADPLDRVEAAWALGRVEDAHREAAEARNRFLKKSDRRSLGIAYALLARAEAALGRADRAGVPLEKARGIAKEDGDVRLRLLVAQAACEAKGDETLLAEFARLAEESGDDVWRCEALLAGARPAASAAARKAALGLLERVPPDHVWRLHALLAGGPDGEPHRKKALDGVLGLADALPKGAREAFLGRPDRLRWRRLVEAPPAGDDLLLARFGSDLLGVLSQVLEAEGDLQGAFDGALAATVRAIGAERGFILLFEEGDRVDVRSAFHMRSEDLEPERFRLSFGVIAKAVREGRPLRMENPAADATLAKHASLREMGLASFLGVPIPGAAKPLGLLYLDSTEKGKRFTPEDEALLVRFAGWLGRALVVSMAARDRTVRIASLERALAAGLADLEARYRFDALLGGSDAMRQLRVTLDHIVRFPYPVLVVGETGTGKELVARAIHANGSRRDKPFVAVNCAALPRELLESELFGHVKGAFTGADKERAGLFRTADRGTLFLDEIGETGEELQRKLLRVLQEGEFTPVGAAGVQKCDVRVVAATNRNLEEEVKARRFREDLYFRLNVFTVRMPPLRERAGDVPLLARHLLDKAIRETGSTSRELTAESLDALSRHSWPGNVRELENAMRHALAFSRDRIAPEHLPKELSERSGTAAALGVIDSMVPQGEGRLIDRLWKALIVKVLEAHGWNQSAAAKELGIARATMYRKLKEYGIQPPA